jgi:hypothetical protein
MDKRLILTIGVLLCVMTVLSGCVNQPPGTNMTQNQTRTPTKTLTFTQIQTPVGNATMPGTPVTNISPTLLKDMAALDQAYIPVLALTSQNSSNNSRKAMGILLPKWIAFNRTYYNSMPGDPGWKTDLDSINVTVFTANALITNGNLTAAHTELEGFRLTMLDLRTRNQIDYFIDKLTLFHDPMERIVLAAQNKAPADVDTALIRQVFPEAVAKWEDVQTADLNAELFDFNQTDVQRIRGMIDNETAALTNLENALKTGDNSTIGNASVAIKPPFSTLFAAFGKFPA